MKPRATTHAGKGTSKHNFREFPKEAKGDQHINRDLSDQNKFFLNGRWLNSGSEMRQYIVKNESSFNKQKERFKDVSRYKDLSLSEKYELLFYEKAFGKTITNQHVRNESRRQQCLNRNAIDMLVSKKTQPEETIFQIGDLKNCPNAVTSEELWAIYKDYQKEHNRRFGSRIKVLDAVLHQDEGTFHIHERKAYIGLNSHNEAYPGKDSALAFLGIERPDKTTDKNRFNNRKQTYSAECRQIWLDVCQEHGIDIETIPREYSDKKGLTTIEYKVQQEQSKLQTVKDKTDKATSNLIAIGSKLDKITNEYSVKKQANNELGINIQKNNMLLRSQMSTIESNKEILKKQELKRQSIKDNVDDLNNQEAEINQRMNILYNKYSEQYEDIDKIDYIAKRLESEFPDYFKELLTDFESQQYMLEYEDIER